MKKWHLRQKEAEIEKDWIFTFGYGHVHANKFIRIHGTMESARREMFHRYGAKWAFQYPGTPEQEQELKRSFITELKE